MFWYFGALVLPRLVDGKNDLTVHVFGQCRGKGPDGFTNWKGEVAKRRFSSPCSGVPLERQVSGNVLVQLKKTGACRVFDLTFAQRYAGDEKYHDDMKIYVTGNTVFPCPPAE